MCAPGRHWRNGERCSPASGILADTPSHLSRSCDCHHARDLRDEDRRVEWEDKGKEDKKGRDERRKERVKSVQRMR